MGAPYLQALRDLYQLELVWITMLALLTTERVFLRVPLEVQLAVQALDWEALEDPRECAVFRHTEGHLAWVMFLRGV